MDGAAELPDGSELAYIEFGDRDRPTAVVVPGLTDGLAPVFHPAGADAVDQPPSAFDDHRVLVVSHRRPMPPDVTTVEMADDLATFLDADGAAPYVLVGHSMGGMVCQHLAATRPDLVDRLVLSSTVPRSDAVFAQRLRRWERLLEEGRWRAFSRDAVDASFVGWERLWRRLILRISGVDPLDPELVSRHLTLSRACREHDATRALHAIETPTVVMVGREDELTRPERGRELAERIDGARLVRIGGAGHGLPEQRGDAYVSTIRRFLDGEAVGERPGDARAGDDRAPAD